MKSTDITNKIQNVHTLRDTIGVVLQRNYIGDWVFVGFAFMLIKRYIT